MDDCSINPARMAMMQTESREPVSGAMHGRGRGGFYRGGARQAHSRHRPNNGHGRNMMGASGENGKALGKIRNFGNRSSDEDATPVPSPVPLPATTNGALPTTNGAGQKRKRDTENGIIQEGKPSKIVLLSNSSDKKSRKSEDKGQEPGKETKDKKKKKEKKEKKEKKDQISESTSMVSDESGVDKSEPNPSVGEKKAEKAARKAARNAMKEAAKGSRRARKGEYTDRRKDKKIKERIKPQPESDESSMGGEGHGEGKGEKKKKSKKDKEGEKSKKKGKEKEGNSKEKSKEKENKKRKAEGSDRKEGGGGGGKDKKNKKRSKVETEGAEEVPAPKNPRFSAPEQVRACIESPKRSIELSGKWNAAEISGGDTRQSKFLRLLGAGRTEHTVVGVKPSGAADLIKQQEQDLEKQFIAGLKMKNEGKRKGLGA